MFRLALISPKKVLLAGIAIAFLTTATSSQAQDDPPAQAGRISYITGNVSYQPGGSDDWQQASPNLPLGPGDRLFTDQNSRAEIQVGQTFVRIGPNSDFSLVDFTDSALSFGLAQGSLHLHAESLWDGQSVYVNTPSGSSSLTRSGELRVEVFPEDQAAVFTAFSGDLDITGAQGFEQPVSSGYALELIGSNPVQAQWVQPSGWQDLDMWSHRRDQQIAQSTSYRYVSPEIPGAYELDAAGTWQPDSPYGPIWYPNNVSYDWAPYRNGHWVNHEPWGWVWVEDENWGYAPFHYGRWVSYNGRWGWVAGPPAAHPIWSPALVVFAGGIRFGGGGVSAWFPLGPGEAYHPWYRCSPRYVDRVNRTNIIESQRVHVQNTYVNVNVTNITYINQTNAISAMRHDDFAAGRSARQDSVHVDPHQFQHVLPLAAPEPRPTHQHQVPIGQQPIRPVPVSVARPILINQRGLAAQAEPGAKPVPPPVRPLPQFRPLMGHTVVAPPPNARPLPQANTPPGNFRSAPYSPAANAAPSKSMPQPAPSAPSTPVSRPFPVQQPVAVPPVNRPLIPTTSQPEFRPNPGPPARMTPRPEDGTPNPGVRPFQNAPPGAVPPQALKPVAPPQPPPHPEFRPNPGPPAQTAPRPEDRAPNPGVRPFQGGAQGAVPPAAAKPVTPPQPEFRPNPGPPARTAPPQPAPNVVRPSPAPMPPPRVQAPPPPPAKTDKDKPNNKKADPNPK